MKRVLCFFLMISMMSSSVIIYAKDAAGTSETEEMVSEEEMPTAEAGEFSGQEEPLWSYDISEDGSLAEGMEDEWVRRGETLSRKKEFTIRDNVLISNNWGENDYYNYSASTMYSNMTIEPNGTYTRVEYASDGYVYIENYSQDLKLISNKKIRAEMPYFGGFHDDGEYYYLAFGAQNPNRRNNAEVFRFVKYSRDWERLQGVAALGVYTYEPFHSGSLRMDSYDGYLYVRAARQMYDGHQSNITMKIRTSDMQGESVAYGIQSPDVGYVSHSFNQFIKVDEGTVYALDHGDAYPRSAALFKYRGTDFGYSDTDMVETMKYYGKTGENYTGANLGGFEISDYAFLTAGSSTKQNGKDTIQNIYVTATSRADFSAAGTQLTWITDHSDDVWSVTNPQLVEINKNRYLLLWTEITNYQDFLWMDQSNSEVRLKYIFIDGKGNKISAVYNVQGALSDCQPVYDANTDRVLWYVTDSKDMKFYTIDAASGAKSEVIVDGTIKGSTWPFEDVAVVPGNWRYDSVKYVYDNGIMNGINGTARFDPDEPLTRAMFATVLYRMAGEPAVQFKNKFEDVGAGRYYSNAVIWAYRQGIVQGVDGGRRYGIDEYITREQIAKMLMEYGRVQNYNTEERAELEKFPDRSSVSGWAVTYMQWAVGSGMINGKNIDSAYYLDPKGNATRVECAAMLTRFMKKYQ